MTQHTASGVPIPDDAYPGTIEEMNRIDAEAVTAGRLLQAAYPIAMLRERAAKYQKRDLLMLAEFNRELADELDRDPRLAGASHLYRGAHGSRLYFINEYRKLLLAHLKQCESTERHS